MRFGSLASGEASEGEHWALKESIWAWLLSSLSDAHGLGALAVCSAGTSASRGDAPSRAYRLPEAFLFTGVAKSNSVIEDGERFMILTAEGALVLLLLSTILMDA